MKNLAWETSGMELQSPKYKLNLKVATATRRQNARIAGPNFIVAVVAPLTPYMQQVPLTELSNSVAIFFAKESNAR
jgi:hypothetical protein